MPESTGNWPIRVGVVVVNHKRRAETLNCLTALAQMTGVSWSLVLVDNGCRDFTAEELRGHLPNSIYLRTDVNLGFAGGANLGMQHALQEGAEAVWFLNNDARPDPQALDRLLAVMLRNPEIGIVGAKILQAGNPSRLDSIALSVDVCSGRTYLVGHDEEDTGQYDELAEVDCVTACAMLVSRSTCECLGGFDDSFFTYLEDVDLCLRARAGGIRVAVAPQARVLHARLPATRGRQSVASLYYATRNHLTLMQRHGSPGVVFRTVRALLIVALNTAYALRAGGAPVRQRLHAVWQGLRDYRRGVMGGVSLEH